MKRKPEENPEHAAWCARVDADVEAECARLNASNAPVAIKPVSPKAADPWSPNGLAPRAKAELRAALRKMETYEVAVLWGLWRAIGPNLGGCDRPVENFIESIGVDYLFSLKPGRVGLTPESVTEHLKTFRMNFRDCIETARRFNAQYPKEVQANGERK